MIAHIYKDVNKARKIVRNYQNTCFYRVLHLYRKYQNTNTVCIHIALLGCSVHNKYNWSALIMISNMQNRFQSSPSISSFAFKLQIYVFPVLTFIKKNLNTRIKLYYFDRQTSGRVKFSKWTLKQENVRRLNWFCRQRKEAEKNAITISSQAMPRQPH